jgi:hypothetical protein
MPKSNKSLAKSALYTFAQRKPIVVFFQQNRYGFLTNVQGPLERCRKYLVLLFPVKLFPGKGVKSMIVAAGIYRYQPLPDEITQQ